MVDVKTKRCDGLVVRTALFNALFCVWLLLLLPSHASQHVFNVQLFVHAREKKNASGVRKRAQKEQARFELSSKANRCCVAGLEDSIYK